MDPIHLKKRVLSNTIRVYTLAAPVVTIGGMYLLNKLRADVMMSKHFLYIIKKYQGNFQDKYKRDNDAQD